MASEDGNRRAANEEAALEIESLARRDVAAKGGDPRSVSAVATNAQIRLKVGPVEIELPQWSPETARSIWEKHGGVIVGGLVAVGAAVVGAAAVVAGAVVVKGLEKD